MQNIEELQAAVASAAKDKCPLSIVGGGTKSFYGREVNGEPLSMAGYSGVIEYQPTELVITAKAGTPINEEEVEIIEPPPCFSMCSCM